MRRFLPVVAALLVGLLLSCVNEYNPWDDYANALMHIDAGASSIGDGDTVDIFTTETLTVYGSVREKIDSFAVVADSNRLWRDTTVSAPVGEQSYQFLISIASPGPRTITITTFRTNGDASTQSIGVQAICPLRQDTISGPLGASYTLSTPSVGDAVYYCWSFGEYRGLEKIVRSPFADNPGISITGVGVGARLTGYLWVTDTAGDDTSPRVPFTYEFYDSDGPQIISLTGNARTNDTIVTGDRNFRFIVTVIDASGEEIDSVELVGGTFDIPGNEFGEFTEVLTGMDAYTSLSPRDVTIRAWDRLGNLSARTFRVYYDSRGPREQLVSFRLRVPQTPSVVTSLDTFPIIVDVVNKTGDTLTLRATNDGTDVDPERLVIGAEASIGWTVPLAAGMNPVTITGYVDGAPVADTTLTIEQNAGAADSLLPQIAAIYIDGQPLPQGQDRFYTQSDTVRVAVVAFDEGSGVSGVSVNGSPCTPVPGQPYQWSLARVALQHPYNALRISVTDNAERETTRDINVVRNALPEIVEPAEFPAVLFVDVAYVETLLVRDDDNDRVSLALLDRPDGLRLDSLGANRWRIAYQPTVAGKDTVSFRISDGVQEMPGTWSFTVVLDTSVLVRFLTASAGFPRYLEAGRETLSVALTMGEGFPPYLVQVRSVSTGAVLVDTTIDTTVLPLTWAPQQADTGTHQFLVTVTDRAGMGDTIKPLPTITVVPRNADPCTLSLAPDPYLTDAGVLDLSTATHPDTLRFAILDSDHEYTESYSVSIIKDNVSTEPTISDRKIFEIIIDPSATSKLRDTIIVVASDRTGSRDTIVVPVIYRIPAPDARADIFLWNAAVESTLTLKGTSPVYVAQWRPVEDDIPVVLDSNVYLSRMPALIRESSLLNQQQAWVHFDRARACNLVDYDQGMWPVDPFTAFFVVRLSERDSDSAYTLLSSCDSYGALVALGVTGEGKAGIISGVGAERREISSNASINANTWYVLTFRSTGIAYAQNVEYGTLAVDIWVNGQGRDVVTMSEADAGPYLLAGASGKHGAIDGWDGDIAEMIVFRSTLGDQERAGVEAYLRSRHRDLLQGGPGGIMAPALVD